MNGVLIPYSSGMGVGPFDHYEESLAGRLNTLFVRYGCGTRGVSAARRITKS